MTINPMPAVATAITNRAKISAPQSSIGRKLFQTNAALTPIAVKASICWSSSIGIEKALIANEKPANKAPTNRPTASIAQPVGVVRSSSATCWRPGKGRTPKKSA